MRVGDGGKKSAPKQPFSGRLDFYLGSLAAGWFQPQRLTLD
jgi:hypothetical protein